MEARPRKVDGACRLDSEDSGQPIVARLRCRAFRPWRRV